jgi:hypothetical protein
MSKAPTQAERDLEEASRQVALAKRRVAAAKGALQYRLKPANLANEAWTSVRSKSELAADEAVGLAKGHPGAIGGVIAAATLFLAREPLWRTLTGMFGRGRRRSEDEGIVTARLDTADENFDLTAPTVERSKLEGVNA